MRKMVAYWLIVLHPLPATEIAYAAAYACASLPVPG